jgi:hypothetical protein
MGTTLQRPVTEAANGYQQQDKRSQRGMRSGNAHEFKEYALIAMLLAKLRQLFSKAA